MLPRIWLYVCINCNPPGHLEQCAYTVPGFASITHVAGAGGIVEAILGMRSCWAKLCLTSLKGCLQHVEVCAMSTKDDCKLFNRGYRPTASKTDLLPCKQTMNFGHHGQAGLTAWGLATPMDDGQAAMPALGMIPVLCWKDASRGFSMRYCCLHYIVQHWLRQCRHSPLGTWGCPWQSGWRQ